MQKATNILKAAAIAILTPIALAMIGAAYLLFMLSVPILDDATKLLNSLTTKNK